MIRRRAGVGIDALDESDFREHAVRSSAWSCRQQEPRNGVGLRRSGLAQKLPGDQASILRLPGRPGEVMNALSAVGNEKSFRPDRSKTVGFGVAGVDLESLGVRLTEDLVALRNARPLRSGSDGAGIGTGMPGVAVLAMSYFLLAASDSVGLFTTGSEIPV